LRRGPLARRWAASAARVPRAAQPAADRRRSVARATAAACALGLVLVRIVAYTGSGHARDSAMLHGFTGLAASRIYDQLRDVALLADPVPYALLGLVCIGVASARRRGARAVAVGIVLIGSGATTHALKHLLAEPRYADWLLGGQIEAASWPSGHATAAMTLALCAVMVASPAWRATVALAAGAGVVALAYATLALTWHYPSDVLAGLLVAGLWVSLALAVLTRLDAGEPQPDRASGLDRLIALGAVGALVGAALMGVASGRVALDTADRATVVVGALTIAALVVALLVATVVAAAEAAKTDAGPWRLAARAAPRTRSIV
jgi:membrane-associated phospholipid phosphatase